MDSTAFISSFSPLGSHVVPLALTVDFLSLKEVSTERTFETFSRACVTRVGHLPAQVIPSTAKSIVHSCACAATVKMK